MSGIAWTLNGDECNFSPKLREWFQPPIGEGMLSNRYAARERAEEGACERAVPGARLWEHNQRRVALCSQSATTTTRLTDADGVPRWKVGLCRENSAVQCINLELWGTKTPTSAAVVSICMIYWICRGLTRGISYNAEGTSHICPIPSFLNNYFKTEMVASFGGGDMAIKVVHANCAYVGYLVWQSHTHSLTYSLTRSYVCQPTNSKALQTIMAPFHLWPTVRVWPSHSGTRLEGAWETKQLSSVECSNVTYVSRRAWFDLD